MFTVRSSVRLLAAMAVCGACGQPPTGLPAASPIGTSPRSEIAVLDLAGYEILPNTLTVQAGQIVRVRNSNSEGEVHNVRVIEVATGAQLFGVGNVPYGSSDHTFERPGFYTVACDIHPMMRADVFVTAR